MTPNISEMYFSSMAESHLAFMTFLNAFDELQEGIQERGIERARVNYMFRTLGQFIVHYIEKKDRYVELLDLGYTSSNVSKALFSLYARKMELKLDDLKKKYLTQSYTQWLAESREAAYYPASPWLSPNIKMPIIKWATPHITYPL